MPVRYLNLLAAAVTLTIGIGAIMISRSIDGIQIESVNLPLLAELLDGNSEEVAQKAIRDANTAIDMVTKYCKTIGAILALIGGAFGVVFVFWEVKLKRSRGQ